MHTDLKPSNIVLRHSDMVKTRRMRQDDFFVDKVRIKTPEHKLRELTRTQMEMMSVELCIVNLDDSVVVRGAMEGRVGSNAYRAPEITLG